MRVKVGHGIFDLYKDFSQLKKGVVETTDRLLSSALLQGCDKEVVELLGKLQRNGFCKHSKLLKIISLPPIATIQILKIAIQIFAAIFEGLKSYVSEYKVQYIRPLTLAEIAFFEARMSLAKQAKGGIPHIYMKGCN